MDSQVGKAIEKMKLPPGVAMDLYRDLLGSNIGDIEDVKKLLRSYGMTRGEIKAATGQEDEKIGVEAIREIIINDFLLTRRLTWNSMKPENQDEKIAQLSKINRDTVELLVRLGLVPKEGGTLNKGDALATLTLEGLISMSGGGNGQAVSPEMPPQAPALPDGIQNLRPV